MLKSLVVALCGQLDYLGRFDDTLPNDKISQVRTRDVDVWDKSRRCWIAPDLPGGVIEVSTVGGRRFKITVEEVLAK